MLEENISVNSFHTESVPGFEIVVRGKEAFIKSYDSKTFGETVQACTQDQIRDLIGIFLDVYETMESNEEEEDNQMNLFSEDDMNEIHDEFEMDELVSNATSFLMMQEDFSNDRISKEDMIGALAILKNSIENYLSEVERSDDSAKNEEVSGEMNPAEMAADFEEPDQPMEFVEYEDTSEF